MSRAAALPAYRPQLATLVRTPPAGEQWLHELKYDGFRIGCRIARGTVQLLSRNDKDWTERFPAVRDAAAALGVRQALLDGEVAMLLPDGRTSFQALQNSGRGGHGRLVYFVFDLLHLDGEDVAALPLEQRKQRLLALLGSSKAADRVLRYSDHVVGRGDEVLAGACAAGAEGIVSKRRDLPHQAGRGAGWQKVKCVQRQEVVIGGFTDPEGARAGIGALLVGVHEDGRLRFAGKVGTGFTQASAQALRRQLEAIAQPASPFDPAPRGAAVARAHWVKPRLVAEVQFAEWTEDGKIRHPSFQGLRDDKPASAVVREVAKEATPVTVKKAAPAKAARAPKRPSATPAAVDVLGVAISHPDRVVYPDAGITKLDVARYYEWVAARMLPHVAGRPLTLVRCPDGVGSTCFYMKHWPSWAPPALRRVRIRERKKTGEYLIADSAEGLVGLAQMGVLEIHTWGSTVEHLEQPDRLVFDLDPGPAVAWPAMIEAAQVVKEALERLNLAVFLKTTGSRGLHLVVPIVPRADWDACLELTRQVADAIAGADPRRYTTAFAKAGRENKILIDYMRNNRTATAVAPYSTRARAGAPVSLPIAWSELTAKLRSDAYTVANLRRRLSARRRDPWAGIAAAAKPLP